MASKTDTYTFAVAGTPALRVKNSAGEVRVSGGEGHTVEVRATRRHTGFGFGRSESDLDAVRVNAQQEGDTVSVTVEHPHMPHNVVVDLDITTPREGTFDIDVAAGRVEVRDTEGPTNIKVSAGQLSLTRVHCTATSRLSVATGQITGSVVLAAGATLDTSVSVGEVSLEVPSTMSAEVDARTQVGQVTVDGLPLAVSRIGFISASTQGRVGDGNGHLDVRVATGSITLRGR